MLMAQSSGSLTAKVLGEDRNDNLSLQAFGSVPIELLLLDGGAGKDKCRATPNVTLVNCEK